MNKAKLREEPIAYEKHHIIPKSLGGDNSYKNIVKLSPREHFISHALLLKMVKDPKQKRSMSYAFVRMKQTNSRYNRIGNGRLYEKLRHTATKEMTGINNPFYGDTRFVGANNPFYGKKHSKETINKIKETKRKNNTLSMFGKNNHFYGKTHTENTRSKISKKQSQPITVIFIDGNTVTFTKRSDLSLYLGVSKAMGIQLCSIKRHLWNKYNIKEILYENNINQESSIRNSI